ncbi:hypothetical protein COPG_00090 [Colwellia phage 9A]|uniref:Uncharacterized protein n=1 Tax=Colwellia phage 9A TaxID=765765 RepID=I3UMH1_9CAUD|nr:hypothetical protein COPG_00090 [Colwellia phage 9A]AFK66686.1 hypothetical protein COPG_00090 [Colwellia phage 9A]
MDSGRKPLIVNKDASSAYIRRKLRRKGFNHSQVASYLRGWHKVKTIKRV